MPIWYLLPLGNTSVDPRNVISIESDQISRSARHDYSLTF